MGVGVAGLGPGTRHDFKTRGEEERKKMRIIFFPLLPKNRDKDG
jgi:hypothetical protein